MNASPASAPSAAARIESNKAVQDATTMVLIAVPSMGWERFRYWYYLSARKCGNERLRYRQGGSRSAPTLGAALGASNVIRGNADPLLESGLLSRRGSRARKRALSSPNGSHKLIARIQMKGWSRITAAPRSPR